MTVTKIRVPSPEVSPTPAFVCSIPDGWEPHDAPGALAAFTLQGVTSVSVRVSVTRVEKEIDLRDVAVKSFAHQRRAHQSVTIDSQRVGRFGNLVVYVRGVTIGDPTNNDPTGSDPTGDKEQTAQVQGLFFGPAGDQRSTADVFSLVGSCRASDIANYGPTFVDVLASITFDGSEIAN
jgi:hypothetical protein